MPGKRAQPISIVKANGRKHLTKKEIEHREKSEIKFGTKDFKCPEFVRTDVVAYKKWLELTKDYRVAAQKGVELVRSPDAGLLARYCKSFSEYQTLLKHRELIAKFEWTPAEAIEAAELFGKLMKKIDYLFSVDGLLSIETAINKKMDMLIKMEDRLFLNPLAKIKNIPKKGVSPTADPNADMFGG